MKFLGKGKMGVGLPRGKASILAMGVGKKIFLYSSSKF
jgi:hypothetical protein